MEDLDHRLLARLTSAAEMALVWDKGIRVEHFEHPTAASAFDWIVQYWQDNHRERVPTPLILAAELPTLVLPEEVEESTDWLAEALRKRFATNQLQEMLRTAAMASDRDPEGALRELHAAAWAATAQTTQRITRVNMADTIDEQIAHYLKRKERPDGLGLTLGLADLDPHTGGVLPGELAVVGGTAKTGKSFFLLNAAIHAVLRGARPIVFTLEVSLVDMRDRAAAIFSSLSYDRISKSKLSDREFEAYKRALAQFKELGGLQIERPDKGSRTVADLCARAREYGADYLIIDPLSFVEPSHRVQSLKEHHANVMYGLKEEIGRAGAELPCLLAAHLRRGDGPEITMESFSNAKEIEDTADLLLGLYRDNHLRANSMMRLDILGARRCDNARYLLRWELAQRTEIAMGKEEVDSG